MKCKLQKITGCIFVLAASVLAFLADVAGAQTTLPSHLNTSKSCHVKSDTARLMNSAKIGKAPDNLNFKAEADPCNFYERAEQMFLWLTSPLPSPHRRGAYVFNSPMFLNAWSADASGK